MFSLLFKELTIIFYLFSLSRTSSIVQFILSSSFRVTEENLVFETVQSETPILFFKMFSLLFKELTFIFWGVLKGEDLNGN